MLVQNLIKIKLINEGYLPNYPYHMISISEMCDAFIKYEVNGVCSGYFYTAYPKPFGNNLSSEVMKAWDDLEKTIVFYLCQLKHSENIDFTLPDWIYSYMLGVVIGPKSNTLDIHDLITPLGVDNLDDEFGGSQYAACYKVSKEWIRKTKLTETYTITKGDIKKLKLPHTLFSPEDIIELRPPTIFGEPHVIKSVRLDQQPLA
ncbi:MAG: hypothetical protein NC320_03300 [Clostridium sp.]|nr:hypothetical protein [Clostridium sp.]